MSEDSENLHGFNPSDFPPKGEITLSAEAQSQARDFVRELTSSVPGANWVAGFIWCFERSIRENKNSDEIDEGPGIDLAGYRAAELPLDKIEIRGKVPVAFIIPIDKVNAAREKKIVEVRTNSGRLSFALI
jgi:hypothetical protein